MIRPDDRVALDLARPFDDPIGALLFFETAFVANEFRHFAERVFSARDAVNVVAVHPRGHVARAFFVRAVAVRVHRVQEPDAAFESKSPIRQRADRANVNHVS